MKKIILSLIFVMGSIVSFGQTNEAKLIEQVNYNKVMMDFCYKMANDVSIKKSERYGYNYKYNSYRRKYERFNKKYNRLYGVKNPINEAGRHLKKSATYEAFSLGLAISGVALTAAISSFDGSDSKNIGITTGMAFGIGSLSCYIASIVNKHKAGKLMNNIKFTGTGVQITF